MANSKVNQNWIEWAKGDWSELLRYIERTYGPVAKMDLIAEFAKQSRIDKHALDILTNIAAGKVVGVVSAPVSLAIDVLEVFTQTAGLIWYWGSQSMEPRTKSNPHNMWKQEIFGNNWYYSSSNLKDYVKYLLYCYPKDRKAGYKGFRYGAEQPRPGQMPLPADPLKRA